METTHARFSGSIPEIYDAHLGPLFFHFYAVDLADRVSVPADGRVLETACGTGIATEKLRARLAPGVSILATDLNEAMVDFARARRGELPGVRFETADATALACEDASFDAVVCQFGVMFFPDKRAAMAEAYRVLRPGGSIVLNTWDTLEANPVARLAHETIAGFFDAGPPTFLPVPYGWPDPAVMAAVLAEAGFVAIAVEPLATVVERPSARHVARGLVEGNPGIHEIRERANAPVAAIVEAVAEALTEAFGDAPARLPLRAFVATARKPH